MGYLPEIACDISMSVAQKLYCAKLFKQF
jgi:hypothetical protein